jgi:hypothetical protein
MLVPANGHLPDKRGMPAIQRFQLALPAQRFRMTRIAFFAVDQHRPNRMQLPVLAEQMVPAQSLRGNIPDPHRYISARVTKDEAMV